MLNTIIDANKKHVGTAVSIVKLKKCHVAAKATTKNTGVAYNNNTFK